MPWFKIDDGFHSHPKVLDLMPADIGIWTLAGTWCAQYLTDGKIGLAAIGRLGGTQANCDALVAAGMWLTEGDNTFQFKDWEDYQPMKSDVEAEREASRERMRSVRAKRKGTTRERSEDVRPNNPEQPANVRENFGGSSEEVRLTPTQPSPTRPDPIKSVGDSRRKPERPLPADWAPNDTHKSFASTEGINLTFQAERFTNWAKAKDARYRDWDAAFRNWLLKAEKSTTNSPSPWDRKGIH